MKLVSEFARKAAEPFVYYPLSDFMHIFVNPLLNDVVARFVDLPCLQLFQGHILESVEFRFTASRVHLETRVDFVDFI